MHTSCSKDMYLPKLGKHVYWALYCRSKGPNNRAMSTRDVMDNTRAIKRWMVLMCMWHTASRVLPGGTGASLNLSILKANTVYQYCLFLLHIGPNICLY